MKDNFSRKMSLLSSLIKATFNRPYRLSVSVELRGEIFIQRLKAIIDEELLNDRN